MARVNDYRCVQVCGSTKRYCEIMQEQKRSRKEKEFSRKFKNDIFGLKACHLVLGVLRHRCGNDVYWSLNCDPNL